MSPGNPAIEVNTGTLLNALPDASHEEITETLIDTSQLRIERIVSQGQCSAPGFWYQQPQAEWVCVLSGQGTIEFEDGQRHTLGPGDWLNIPTDARHRVAETATGRTTVWLAVFYTEGPTAPAP